MQQPIEMPAESWHWTGWLAALFCVGLGLGGVRLLLGLVSVARLRRSGEKITEAEAPEQLDIICAEFSVTRRVLLSESQGVSSAATIGWLRPLVLLPSDWRSWSPEELRTVLAHEVAHIAHRDFPCWLLAQVGLLLHFYHPLVHWLAGRLRLEQELAADADAARHSGGAQEYLRNLAELAVRQADRPVAWPARTFSSITRNPVEESGNVAGPKSEWSVARLASRGDDHSHAAGGNCSLGHPAAWQ